MATRDEMLAMLEEDKEIREKRIIADKDGQVYVNFHDAAVLNSAESYSPDGTGLREYNPDVSLASTGKTIHAMNPDFYFMNRYRVKRPSGRDQMWVVSGHTPEGFRLIKEQATGKCFMHSIPVAVIMRDKETKELYLDRMTTVTEAEFISDFTKTLDNKSMAEILPLIVNHGAEISADEMPI